MDGTGRPGTTVTFAGSGDAFGSGGRYQACIHLRALDRPPVLLDCGATSLSALRACGLDPREIAAVLVSHLHGDHFGGLPFLILDGQFTRRITPLTIAGPPGIGDRLHQAMEASFPGSARVRRRFDVDLVELTPDTTASVGGISVRTWEVDHPSGAPPLALRLTVDGADIGYTGDTAWTEDLPDVADGADLLIAEAYYFDKAVPYHLRHADLVAHRSELTSRRIVLTHMSADMLARAGNGEAAFETAHDGMVIHLLRRTPRPHRGRATERFRRGDPTGPFRGKCPAEVGLGATRIGLPGSRRPGCPGGVVVGRQPNQAGSLLRLARDCLDLRSPSCRRHARKRAGALPAPPVGAHNRRVVTR